MGKQNLIRKIFKLSSKNLEDVNNLARCRELRYPTRAMSARLENEKGEECGSNEIKDNIINLLEEDLWCVHKYLDDLELPRTDDNGETYSIVGRIKRLEKKYLMEMSELETKYLSEIEFLNKK
jgi:hypothetical protein